MSGQTADEALDGVSAGEVDRATPVVRRRTKAPVRPARTVTLTAARRRLSTGEAGLYAVAAVLSLAATTVMTRLWRATWNIPFVYSVDALSSAGHFKTTLTTGWYESQPMLGAPYGQHYHDYPFTDDLHPFVIKLFGLFTSNWPVVFNLYYIAGFPLAALTAVWFFRRCGLSPVFSAVLAVLFSVAPYHLWRNENHFFLGEYWAVPLAMGVVLAIGRGEPVWGVRRPADRSARPPWPRRLLGLVTGRGAGTTLILALVVADGAYYGVFTGVLLAAAAVLGVVAHHNIRRFTGALAAGAVLVATFVALSLPDVLYRRVHGDNSGALVRLPRDAELYAVKLSSLLLPADGHVIPAFARLRNWYDTTFPLPSEQPALGLLAAVGFLLLLGVPVVRLFRRPATRNATWADARRDTTLIVLAALTWVAFLMCTTGGFGTFVAFFSTAIRGWNRMSIILGLLALAGLGLFVQRRLGRLRPGRARVVAPVLAVVALLVGCIDQSSSHGIPDYDGVAAQYRADDAFFAAVQARVPVNGMVFQTPYIAWPEAGQLLYGAVENDQLIPFLHTRTVRWSGGGFKGRPQVDWTQTISDEAPDQMLRDLAVLGFSGVLVDRMATPDDGSSIIDGLTRLLGEPAVTEQGGRWVYFSMRGFNDPALALLSPAQRAAAATAIDHIPGG